MKKIIFALLLLMSAISCLNAANTKDINELLQRYTYGPVKFSTKLDFFRTLEGDTIRITNISSTCSNIFVSCVPDTLWIKKRPKKNPKENVHYVLQPIYKGVLGENGKYLTPSDAILNKPLKVLSVTRDFAQGYHVWDHFLKVVNLEDSDTLVVQIKEVADVSLEIMANKCGEVVEPLVGNKFYVKNAGKYELAQLKSYSYPISIAKSTVMTAFVCLNFAFENGDELIYDFKDSYRGYVGNILTEAEYYENYAPRTVSSELNDSILNSNVSLPFEFESCVGQIDSYSASISQKLDPTMMSTSKYSSGLSSNYTIKRNELIRIVDKFSVKGKQFYTAIYNGKAFFIEVQDVHLIWSPVSIDDILKCNKEQKEYYFQKCLQASKESYVTNLRKYLDEYDSYSKYGLAIVKWGVYDESEYTDGTGIRFTFLNPTDNKTIKYININFVGYNAVDDPVYSRNGYTISKRCIGPIAPKETAQYEFEYAWFSDVVEYAQIKSISIQYTDGSTKNITKAGEIMFSSSLRDFLNESNPVSSFK